MESAKKNFISTMMYHIINNNDGWKSSLGYYIYYKEGLKNPSKKLLKKVSEQCVKEHISKINNGFEIDETNFVELEKNKDSRNHYNSNKDLKNLNSKGINSNSNSNSNKDLKNLNSKDINSNSNSNSNTNSNSNEDIDTSSYIKLSENYKFTGVNRYNDLVKPNNMSDKVYKEMIYMRSQFSKNKFSKFQYSFPENFMISQI